MAHGHSDVIEGVEGKNIISHIVVLNHFPRQNSVSPI